MRWLIIFVLFGACSFATDVDLGRRARREAQRALSERLSFENAVRHDGGEQEENPEGPALQAILLPTLIQAGVPFRITVEAPPADARGFMLRVLDSDQRIVIDGFDAEGMFAEAGDNDTCVACRSRVRINLIDGEGVPGPGANITLGFGQPRMGL